MKQFHKKQNIFSDMFKTGGGGGAQGTGGTKSAQDGNKLDPNNPANLKTGPQDPNVGNDQNKGKPADPLDSFKGLWDTKKPGADSVPPVFQLDPKILADAAGSLDFASAATPEIMEKIRNGDITGLQELANGLGRQIYQTSLQHTSHLTDRFVGSRVAHDLKGVGQSVQQKLTNNTLDQLVKDNPLMQEHVRSVGARLLDMHPDASPDWIGEQVKAYFVNVAKGLDPSLSTPAPGSSAQGAGNTDKPIDWAAWLATPSQRT